MMKATQCDKSTDDITNSAAPLSSTECYHLPAHCFGFEARDFIVNTWYINRHKAKSVNNLASW